MNRLDDAASELALEWSVFCNSWRETKVCWKDAKATHFEQKFMSAWEADVPTFLAALEALEEELQAAEWELQ